MHPTCCRALVAGAFVASAILAAPAFAVDAVLKRDAYVATEGASTAKKFGKKPTLALAEGKEGLLGFDLTTLPAGTTPQMVQKANLWLALSKVKSDGTLSVRAALSTWSEADVTGATAPGFATSAFDPQGVPLGGVDAGGTIVVDVTVFVQKWLEGSLPNNGLVLVPDSGSGLDATIEARESSKGWNRARLEIVLADSGPKGDQGLPGPPGPKGDQGDQGPSGFIASTNAEGSVNTTLNSSGTFQFVGQTATITVGTGETLFAFASGTFGTSNGSGTGSAQFDLGVRPAGSGTNPVVAGGAQSASFPFLNRYPLALADRFAGLVPGTYEVGLVAKTASNNWNFNENTRVLAWTAK